jgi:hypothetical protein
MCVCVCVYVGLCTHMFCMCLCQCYVRECVRVCVCVCMYGKCLPAFAASAHVRIGIHTYIHTYSVQSKPSGKCLPGVWSKTQNQNQNTVRCSFMETFLWATNTPTNTLDAFGHDELGTNMHTYIHTNISTI